MSEHEKALREYEKAHEVWMQTSIFDPLAKRVRAAWELYKTREKYVKSWFDAHPEYRLKNM